VLYKPNNQPDIPFLTSLITTFPNSYPQLHQ
jgi:hypothetical protein